LALFLAARTVLVARAAPGAVEKVKGCGYADVGSWTKARDALLSMACGLAPRLDVGVQVAPGSMALAKDVAR